MMKDIPDKSVDLVLCDPPYGSTACKWDVIIPFELLWNEYSRIIKKSGTIAIFNTEPFGSYLRISNLKDYKYDWIWQKNTGTNFFHSKRQPIRYTENISVFQDGSSHYYPIKTVGHVPTNSGKGRNTGNVYSGKSRVDYEGGDTTRYPKNIISIDTVDNYHRLHPSEKPVALLEYLIRTYTNEGEIVLDNTMGSGSTGVAALNTNRRFIGIELDATYCDIAKRRILGETAVKQTDV